MELKVLLFLFLVIFVIQETKAGRSGGGSRYSGGSRSGSRNRGSWGSSSSSSGSRIWGSSGSSGGSSSRTWGSSSIGGSIWGNKGSHFPSSKPKPVTQRPVYHAPTTRRIEYRTRPSAPIFEEHKKPVYSQPSNNKPSSVTNRPVNYNYKTTPSAPPLGGAFGGYYNGISHGEKAGGVKVTAPTQKPYIPPSILQPTKFNPPYPTGHPQGLHPVPQNTGSSFGSPIGNSKYPQASSQPSSNPHYPDIGHSYPQSGSHPYPAGTHQYPGSYPSGTHQYPGSYPHTGSYPYPSGTHSSPGSYGNQGHSSYPQGAPYPQQGSYPTMNTGGFHPNYPAGGASISQPGVVYIPSAVSSSRGTGDILKEALIYSTVNAGVNAAANRIFYPSHFSGHNYEYGSGRGNGYGGGYDHTQITHNNYYYNQPPGVPQGVENMNAIGTSTSRPDNSQSVNSNSQGPNNQPTGGSQPVSGTNNGNGNVTPGVSTSNGPYNNNPNVNNPNNNQPNNANVPPSYQPRSRISNEELRNLTEDLFSRQEFDVNKYIKLNLQKMVNSTNITDESTEPLFEIQPEANTIPTIELIRNLYDNYEYDSQIKEKATPEKLKEQNDFLEVILQTNVMSGLMKWLIEQNYIAPDMLSKKEILTRIWFTLIEGSTSAFERTFLAEKYWNTNIMGLQNWVYVSYAESKKEVDYMGYMEKLDLGNKGSLVKAVFKSNGIIQPSTVFVGTLPELEMALYTICFYARPNELCPVSLGGAKFNIGTHTFQSWGKDLLDVAVPLL